MVFSQALNVPARPAATRMLAAAFQSRSYYAGTTGVPALTTVENYIRNQKRPTG
ncbi:hypothetical protein [Actinomyces sp. HMSC065F12]|uniref:hypothetical protein n=1 Tax=Actinomyces sp. HMSC065F12 TaxID=1739479 RepID=UPI001877A95E|nr:hypothetical protein [Actinomyces sp. HMSC065F12]